MLAGGVLVERVLHRDAHVLEHQQCALAQITGHIGGGEIEVGTLVEWFERQGRVAVAEVEELHLGGDIERVPALMGPIQVALQHLTGIAIERCAVGVHDVAEHASGDIAAVAPGQELEGVGVRLGEHIALLDPAEAVDGRAVEVHALLEGVLELVGGDGHRFELPEHIGEPQADEADSPLLGGAEDVILLAFHA